MLTLKPEDIFIGCRANSKKKALRIAADSLQASGYVSEGFFESMVDREKALSTWLGAGVAMPHCSKEGIDLVRQTGFQLFQFPDGVGWGEGKVAFLVVAVAVGCGQDLKWWKEFFSVLRMTGYNGYVSLEMEDLTMSVEAGLRTSIDALNATLSQ